MPTSIQNATSVDADVQILLDDMFAYHKCDANQQMKMEAVRHATRQAVAVIIDVVPPSADRSAAIRKIREARMDANSAISTGGRY